MASEITGTIDEYIASLPPDEQALIALYGRWLDEEMARWPRGMTRRQRITAAKRRARIVTAGHRATGSRKRRSHAPL